MLMKVIFKQQTLEKCDENLKSVFCFKAIVTYSVWWKKYYPKHLNKLKIVYIF